MGMGSLTGSTWAKVRESFADARQTGLQHLFAEVIQLELDMRAPGTIATTPFADLDHDGTGHHVATGQVLGIGGITLHEALAILIEQITALTTTALGHQHPGTGDTGRVELPELHVLHPYPGAQRHADTVAGVDVGIGGGLVDTTGAASGQHGGLGLEVDHFAALHIDGGTANDVTVLVFHQIQRIPLGEDGGLVLDVSADRGCAAGRDRYGRPPPRYEQPARHRNSWTDHQTDAGRQKPLSKREKGRPMFSSS